MVYDKFVAAVWPERGLDGLADGATGINVSNDGAIFCIVAGCGRKIGVLAWECNMKLLSLLIFSFCF